ncbi:MAG: hypothetical protein CL878_00660 [Dehalococcoidia bacterium]|nr:hypothetical protein [Dehalococcoidia bacterium]
MVEMVVDSIRIDIHGTSRMVVLKEPDSDRILPIIIGPAEAEAIAIRLQKAEVPRPLTHDLLANAIGALNGQVTHVLINDLLAETFYARIVLDVDGRHVELDARSSDAIALAVRAEVPIYVADAVLERVGSDAREAENEEADKEESQKTEQDERLDVFRDFIEQLDIDDLGKSER